MVISSTSRLVGVLLCALLASGFFNARSQADEIPTITSEPQPQTAFVGANVNLRVGATPNVGLRYRWRFHGTNLPSTFPGQNTSLLMITNAQTSSAGPYSVVVSNSFGAVTSVTAIVSINAPTGIAVAYINLNATPGYSLFASSFVASGANQTVASLIYATVDGVSLFKVDGNGFIANNYLDGWSVPQMLLTPGEGWFLHNPTTTPFTLTQVGAILIGRLTNQLPAGLSLCASLVPQAGPLSNPLLYPSGTDGGIFQFDRPPQTFRGYSRTEQDWQPAEPSIAIGEAFFAVRPAGAAWSRAFNIDGRPVPESGYLVTPPALASETAEINFFTYHTDPALGRILDLDGVTPANSDFMGQLYSGPTNNEATLSPIGNPVPFLSGVGAGYIRSSTIKLPGVPGGQTVHLQLRAWERCAGDTYEQALENGSACARSPLFTAVAHATIENGIPGLPPGHANTFPSTPVVLGLEVPLRVARIQSTGGVVELCWATRPGATYRVQRATTWADPTHWTTLPSGQVIPGTGRVARLLDSPGNTPSFYRVSRIN